MQEQTTMAEVGKQEAIELVARGERWEPTQLGAVEVEGGGFKTWRFWCVQTLSFPPASFFVSTHGTRALAVSFAEGLEPIVAVEPLALADEESALAHLRFFLSVTMYLAKELSSVDDIIGVSLKDRDRWALQVKPAAVRSTERGFHVRLWLFDRGTLLLGEFEVERSGKIGVALERVADGVGIPLILL